MVFDKIFGWTKKKEQDPPVFLGRYSDNNKSVEKVNRWTEADQFFKKGEYQECLDAFFDYLTDDALKNVEYSRSGKEGIFQLYQGSKIVKGKFDENRLQAEVTLAGMPAPSIPVMRRLLEMNFNLYYTRFALKDKTLCMCFDSDLKTANPNKLYYGLKELATKADKQDDLLVHDFSSLEQMDTEHVIEIPESEKEKKFAFMQEWIKETLDYIQPLDQEKFSGGIAYLLLTLAFRIDYLIVPEGKLLSDIEKIVELYYKKSEKQTVERNDAMIEGFKKLGQKKREEVYPFLFRSRQTFAIVPPQNQKTISDTISGASQNMFWYRDNKHPFMANKVLEYGFSYCQYSYSLPRPMSEFFRLFMQINYPEFFEAIGFTQKYYSSNDQQFDKDAIEDKVREIIEKWKEKYPRLELNPDKLNFQNLVDFNHSFTTEMASLNFEG
jgi:hypothetical protein